MATTTTDPTGLSIRSGSQIPFDDRQLAKWVAKQPFAEQKDLATHVFQHFLKEAGQPGRASSNACIKLCYFLEQCQVSDSSQLRNFVFRKSTCVDLFNYYIEFNEKGQTRWMRQILELISSIILRNPDEDVKSELRNDISRRNLAILTHQDAQPLVKPAFKCLEHFLGKDSISANDIISNYDIPDAAGHTIGTHNVPANDWDRLLSEIFEWMRLSDIAPAAGKFLVSMFRALKGNNQAHSSSWQRWISNGLVAHPEALENVKLYLFPPLFKLDRAGSIVFLEDLNNKSALGNSKIENDSVMPLLRLSAVETGKKLGLIKESATLSCFKTAKKTSGTVEFSEESLEPLVVHSSETVRSLAFSVLVSSLSTVRPYSYTALRILRSCMDILYADSDAKFRNEVMSNTKHMIERLRGATSLIAKELERVSCQAMKDEKLDGQYQKEQEFLRAEVEKLATAHKDFLEWYLEFLMGELNPNASYQRHVTALKAILLLLHSGIDAQIPSRRHAGNDTVWPYTVHIFTLEATRLLLDLLLDPFEDVRSTAADILRLAPPGTLEDKICSRSLAPSDMLEEQGKPLAFVAFTHPETEHTQDNKHVRPLGMLQDFISHAQMVATKTGRADYADGLARSLELFYSLQYTEVNKVEQQGFQVQGRPELSDFAGTGKADKKNSDIHETTTRSPTRVGERKIEQDLGAVQINAIERLSFAGASEGLSSRDDEKSIKVGSPQRHTSTFIEQEKRESHAHHDFVLHLIVDLERKVTIAEKDLGRAVLEAPIHGDFAALRLIWESSAFIRQYSQQLVTDSGTRAYLDNLQRRLTAACSRLWAAVKDILCNDSPEGHLPDDLEDTEAVDTKSILSYSFRAVHESSNLLKSLLTKITVVLSDCLPFLPLDLFDQIGDLTFDQLSHLRHRGAFSTVASTFATACQLTRPERSKLVQWYQEAVKCINEQSSTTRRSAGIPALLIGIMSAQSIEVPFNDVMKDLMEIACKEPESSEEEDTSLPQVHAMNSLRENFKSSSLGARCEPYIGTCLELAVENLRSDFFPLRNCGLLLLRSLIDNLFGTSVGKSEIENGWDGRSIQLQYTRYPQLARILQKLLDGSVDSRLSDGAEAVLPALEILRRAGPPPEDRSWFSQIVVEHLASPLWAVRDMAARAFCALTMKDDIGKHVMALLRDVSGDKGLTNRRHGYLLAVRFIIARHVALGPEFISRSFNAINATLSQEFAIESSSLARPPILKELYFIGNTMLSACGTLDDAMQPSISDTDFESCKALAFLPGQNRPISEQRIIQVILMAALRKDPDSVLAIVENSSLVLDSDASSRLLNVIWSISHSGMDYLKGERCLEMLYFRSFYDPTAVDCLSKILEHHYRNGQDQQDRIARVTLSIFSGFGQHKARPMGTTAWITLGGWAAHFNVLAYSTNRIGTGELSAKLSNWVLALRASGRSQENLDYRHAAALSMSYFFRYTDLERVPTELLRPVYLTLYDLLNDDDSDLRKMGALIVSNMAKSRFADLRAAKWVAKELLPRLYGLTNEFTWDVVQRMTGMPGELLQGNSKVLEPVSSQCMSRFARDDDLVAIEKPNLYLDEIRELDLWAGVFYNLPLQASGRIAESAFEPVNALLDWVVDGLPVVTNASTNEEFVTRKYHWDSKAPIFALCAKVITCSKALVTLRGLLTDSADQKTLLLEQKLFTVVRSLANLKSVANNRSYHPWLLARL